MSDNKPKSKIFTNATSNMLAFVFAIIVTFFMTPILVNGLGDDRYGIWVFVESIIKYLALFDLGITAAVVKYIAKFNATQDKREINRVYSTSMAIFSVLGFLIALTSILYAVWGSLPDTISPSLALEARIMIALLGFNLAFGLPMSVYNSIISAIELYWLKNVVQIVTLFTRSLVFLWVLSMGWGIVGIGIAITVFSLFQQLTYLFIAHRKLPSLGFSFGSISKASIGQIGNYSIWTFIAAISSRVSFQTDAIVIGICIDPSSVTYFAIAGRLIGYSKSLVRSATMVLTPRFSVLESRKEHDEIRGLLIYGTRISLWTTCFLTQGLIILGPSFIGTWMGERFQELSSPVLIILAAPLFLFLSQSVSSRVLYGIGKVRPFAIIVGANALINLSLSLVLVRFWGMEGVAMGTTIPCCIQPFLIAYIVCRETQVSKWEFFTKAYLAPLCGASIATIAWVWLLSYLTLNSYVAIFYAGLIGFALNLGIALLLDRQLRQQFQSTLVRRFSV
ncbi:MAG: oligosaccharide flippase family protein [Mariniblastus sp.]|nr:oligosaccharide flippase family protein [Mariniblastus sp.]